MNTIPILQQEKSSITTNPFIPNEQKQTELETIDREANKILEENYKNSQRAGIKYTNFGNIHQRIANSIIGVLNDLFEKPKSENIIEHLINIFVKDQRYAYIGVFLIILAFVITIIRKSNI